MVRVVLREKPIRLPSLESHNAVHVRDIFEVLGGDVARLGGVEEGEGVVVHLLLACTSGGAELRHQLIKQLLHTVHRGAEALEHGLNLVAERIQPLPNLDERWLDEDEKLVQKISDDAHHFRNHFVDGCLEVLFELLHTLRRIGQVKRRLCEERQRDLVAALALQILHMHASARMCPDPLAEPVHRSLVKKHRTHAVASMMHCLLVNRSRYGMTLCLLVSGDRHSWRLHHVDDLLLQ
mmetsp:Transcript_99917/g.213942  ORF Transcript_99917/g.213942 Transcript_99917/m.213942 type:complete len:237 (+) Transcript_99917:2066-2776(+)